MGWKPRLATVTLTIGALGILTGELIPAFLLLLLGLALLWSVPGCWRAILYGGIGGLIGGILVLGPGFRLAMRVVAVLDPVRPTEFSTEGTLFILIIIGGVMGTIFGMLSSLIRNGWSIKSAVAWPLPGSFVMLMLLANEEFRGELLTLGAGPWVNIPMFATVAAAYGWVTMGIVARLDSRRETRRAAADQLEVPA